jgi:murein DD-endopeptidase MepM/ murein hydrolase activator NlpD
MAFRALTATPRLAGIAIVAAAIGSACFVWAMRESVSPATDDPAPPSSPPLQTGAPADASAVRATPATPVAPAASATHVAAAPARLTVENAVITRSFADAAQRLGIDAATTLTLSRAFAGQLDFRRDLPPGSTIRFVFRTRSPRGATGGAAHTAHPPRPVAVRISTGTADHTVFLYRNLAGKAFYYAPDGRRHAASFRRYPLRFTRISSPFSKRRFDPFTHRWAAHEGVDLAAPTGTPVHATARGVVTFAGWQTGYGRVVEMKNVGPYSTTFAHLSRLAPHLRAGSRVRQGQVIGYVGATGWATGPHLHYEVHVNGVPRNPLTVALPRSDPLRGADQRRFAQQVEQLDALL